MVCYDIVMASSNASKTLVSQRHMVLDLVAIMSIMTPHTLIYMAKWLMVIQGPKGYIPTPSDCRRVDYKSGF